MPDTAPTHFALISSGSDGDIFPFFGLGKALVGRGHRVTLATSDRYQTLAEDQGFGFRPLVSSAEADSVFENADSWHPLRSALITLRFRAQCARRQYEMIASLVRDGRAVLVVNPWVLAASVVKERLAPPMATILVNPWQIPSIDAPPVMPGVSLPTWAPGPMGRFYWWTFDLLVDLIVRPDINRLRQSLDLRPVRRILRWPVPPDLAIGLFPDWYGPPQPDWPAGIRLAGFLHYDGPANFDLPVELREFCRCGPPPVAFTFGTRMMHAADLFREALSACRTIGTRGVFLTRYPAQLPRPLPPEVRHCEFAPLRELLPLCAALVHHGGIGTTARALAAGTPQLIVPQAYDQFDNARRIERLGAGEQLKRGRRTAPCIATALARLTAPAVQARCRALAAEYASDDCLDRAVRWLEELANTRRNVVAAARPDD